MYNPQDLVFIHRNNEIIELRFYGPSLTPKEDVLLARYVKSEILFILNSDTSKKYSIILNVLPRGNTTEQAGTEARPLYKDIFEHPQISKVAIVNSNTFIAIIINYFARLLSRNHMRHFYSLEEAYAWTRSSTA